MEALRAAVLQQNPLVANPGPVIAHLRPLHEQSAVGVFARQRALPDARKPLLSDDIDDEHSGSSQVLVHVPQYPEIVLLVYKVTERSKDTAREIESRGTLESSHVLHDPLDGHAGFRRSLARTVQQKRRFVHARDCKPTLRKLSGVPARSAAEIEHRAPVEFCQ